MNGKIFKEWAATIHDDAVIEINEKASYMKTFDELEPQRIRARSISYPCGAEEAQKEEVEA